MILARMAFLTNTFVKSAFLFFFLLTAVWLKAQTDTTRSNQSKNDTIKGAGNSSAYKNNSSFFNDGLHTNFDEKKDSTVLFRANALEGKWKEYYCSKRSDTTLEQLHNYYTMGVLGNIGLPTFQLMPEEKASPSFFKWMSLNNRNDLLTTQQPVYYKPQGKVYTKLFASMGQKQEQVFKIVHSQNIRNVNISLAFNRYSCFGFYNLQKTISDNLLFSSHGQTKKGGAGYQFYFLYNKLKYQLNGGFDTSKVNFEKNINVDKKLFPTLLSAAKQNIRTSEVNLSGFIRLAKGAGSSEHKLAYEVNYQGHYWLYADGLADTSYYSHTNYYVTNTGSHDSVSVKILSNAEYYRFESNVFLLYAGYKNEFAHYNQVYTDTMVMNHIVDAGMRFNKGAHSASAWGQFSIAGFNSGNYKAGLKYRWQPGMNLFLRAKGDLFCEKPSFMNTSYYGAHQVWTNTFTNILTQNATVELGSNQYNFIVGLFAQQQSGMVYFDTLALPVQKKGGVALLRAFAAKDLKMGPVHLLASVNWQQTSDASVMRIPQLYAFGQLYYENRLFKKNLWLRVGFQSTYISSFKANAYMPSINQFYLQDSRSYGNYYFVDFFVNARIERFTLFLAATHLNQGLSGSGYILCPNYAMPDRSLKAGLSWLFND